MWKFTVLASLFTAWLMLSTAFGADTVPTDVQQPGTQPLEIGNLESPGKCDNCHGGYNSAVEPAHNWRGSMMSHAGRDPIFWATVAIAEQDFDGVGDLCIRCHSTAGWLAGRSTPTDGSGLAAGDSDGVECDYCHKLTNPDDSDLSVPPLVGEMNEPFVANEVHPDGNTVEGYYGSGMSSMWGGSDKLGPYDDADARHQFRASPFHRSEDFCGTCHDVSNAVVGDLAPNFGRLFSTDTVETSGGSNEPGILGAPVDIKAAFNNPPYRYGVVERTFSEFKSGAIRTTAVDDYPTLPEELQGGALEAIYNSATQGGTVSADYQNPATTRYYTCQTCHMRPVTGTGANKRSVPVRTDLPLHDMTGGNYWMPWAIKYLDERGLLRLGGGMSDLQTQAMLDGALRAQEQLQLAASLEAEGNRLEIINHTGHKLITGYPEGRRMWLNVKWYDDNGVLLREDGKYGDLTVDIDGTPTAVQSILDLHDPNLVIFEAHMGMTQEWAKQLILLGYGPGLVLNYDRITGADGDTLGDLAALPAGSAIETFHFALNNTVIKDNRIPPYGMSYDEAERRNASPVPQDQYDGTPGGVYDHYAEVSLNPPAGAVSALIELLYQPTSWEYIQFLYLANNGNNAFLAAEGANMLDAWLNAEVPMAPPFTMASATWGTAVPDCDLDPPTLVNASAGDKEVSLDWTGPAEGIFDTYRIYYDQAGKAQWIDDCIGTGCTSYTDTALTNGQTYCYKVTTRETDFAADPPETVCESGFSNILCATPQPPGQVQTASVTHIITGHWVREGKGRNARDVWVETTEFAAGDEIVFLLQVNDAAGQPVAGAIASLAISGPESPSLTSMASDSSGLAEARWATESPNKKGVGGTPPGPYTATVSGLSASSHTWDGAGTAKNFTIGVGAARAARHHHHGM